MSKEQDPTLVNTSYLIFFHVAAVLFAYFFATTFPPELFGFSLAINLVYAIGIFWLFYLLRQYLQENPILLSIIAFFSISALLGFASAVKGPLAGGEMPVLGLSVINQKIIYWGAQTSLIYAAVVISYGYITYVSSVLVASVMEFFYNRVLIHALPTPLRRRLTQIDYHIDRGSDRFSTKFFFMDQRRGILVTVGFLLSFAAVYTMLLVTA